VWGPRQDVDTALAEIVIRCREATRGVPNETRQVLPELDTDFERILPGPDRMYPDTDSPPLPIPAARTAEVAARLPHPPAYWREQYGAVLHREQLEQLVATGRAPLFDAVVRDTAAPPALVAHLLTAVLTHVRRQGGDLRHLDRDFFVDLLQRYAAGAVSRDALPAIVLHAARDGRRPAAEMTQFARLSRAELAPLVAQVAGLGLPLRRPAKRAEHLAGRVRERTGVRADGRDLVALLRSEP
jgi:glutamyl-tRNA(Gln) amidotransferase subunit E